MGISKDVLPDDNSDDDQSDEYAIEFDEIAREWNGLGRDPFAEYDDSIPSIDRQAAARSNGAETEIGGDDLDDFDLPLSALLSDDGLAQLIEFALEPSPLVSRIIELEERIYQLYLEDYQTVRDEETILERLSSRPSAAHLIRRLEAIQEWKTQLARQMNLLESDRQRLKKSINY